MSSRLLLVASLIFLLLAGTLPVGSAERDEGASSASHLGSEGGQVAEGPARTGSSNVAYTLDAARWSIGATAVQKPGLGGGGDGSGVRVAVIDTGIDPAHPDLGGRVVAWRDFVHEATEPYDDHGHGTHVAGTIAASGHLQLRPDKHYFPFGARGVAPGVDLIVAKAITESGTGSAHRIAQAVLWALDPDGDPQTADGADVINLSLGASWIPDPSIEDDGDDRSAFRAGSGQAALEDAIRQAVSQGVVVVVAAGNQPAGMDLPVAFPASMSEVVTVGATDRTGQVAAFSRGGNQEVLKPDLVAPGVLLSSSANQDGSRSGQYRALGGTSMAAALVSGAVALLLEADPTLGPMGHEGPARTERIRTVLTATADPLADPANRAGHGSLRVDTALAEVGAGQGSPGKEIVETVAVAGFLAAGMGLYTRFGGRKVEMGPAALERPDAPPA